jgi:nucleoside-diphosphate-sugar epimerase
MRKKILILGSSGMIGSHLSNHLKNNFDILHFDLLNSSNQDLRIYNNKNLIKKIRQSHFIFFLAFDIGGSKYLRKYQETFDFINNNLKIMINTFEVLNKYKKRFVFATSAMSDFHFSSYGNLKLIGERYVNSIRGISVKLWNVYGYEEQTSEKIHVINDFIRKGLNHKKIASITDGNESRDFLYIDDCVRAFEIIINNYEKLRKLRTIDIAYNKFVKIKNIAKIIKNIFLKNNKPIKLSFSKKNIDETHKNIRNKPNLLFKRLWRPKITLDEGISAIYNLHVTNDKY